MIIALSIALCFAARKRTCSCPAERRAREVELLEKKFANAKLAIGAMGREIDDLSAESDRLIDGACRLLPSLVEGADRLDEDERDEIRGATRQLLREPAIAAFMRAETEHD